MQRKQGRHVDKPTELTEKVLDALFLKESEARIKKLENNKKNYEEQPGN